MTFPTLWSRVTVVRVAPALFVSKEVDVATKANVGTFRRSFGSATPTPDYHGTGGISDYILLATKFAIDNLRVKWTEVGVATSIRLVITI